MIANFEFSSSHCLNLILNHSKLVQYGTSCDMYRRADTDKLTTIMMIVEGYNLYMTERDCT